MKYYRLIFKQEETGKCVFSEILDQEMNDQDFQKMNWEKPIIRHIDNGHHHFISLEKTYLETMLLGIQTFQHLEAPLTV
jgi:hypothetical protein